MVTNSYKACKYLIEYADNIRQNQNSYSNKKNQLDYLTAKKKELKSIVSGGFSFLNNYSSIEQLKQIKDSEEFLNLLSIIGLIIDDEKAYATTLLKNIFLLHSKFNEYTNKYDLEDEEPQYINANTEFQRIDSMFYEIIKNLTIELDDIQKSDDFKVGELIERILKNDEDGITLNGNLTAEELDLIISILDNSDLSIDDKNDFMADLIPEMVQYKKKKDVLDAKITTDKLKNSLNTLTHRKQPVIEPLKKRNAEFDYDRIKKAIENLQKKYPGVVDYSPIDENTPFDKVRIKLYNTVDKGINYNLVLYDLQNFINPERVESLWEEDKISPRELDAIRNIIYKWIINKVKLLDIIIPSQYAEQEEITEENSIESIQEAEQLIIETEYKPPKDEPEEYVNKSIKYLTDEEKERVENALTFADQFTRDFEEKYPPTKISKEELMSFLLAGNTYSYNIDLSLIKLYLVTIPDLKKTYDSYESIYEELRTSQELEECEIILTDEYKKLMKLVDDVLPRIEVFGDDVKEEKNIAANILLIDQDYPDKKSKVSKDALAIKKTGQYDGEFVESGLQTLKNRPYTEAIGVDHKYKVVNKHLADAYNPRVYKQSSVIYAYIVIYVCDENIKELKERYKIENNDIRLLYIPTVFYSGSSNDGFANGEKRMSSNIDTIEWYKKLFKNPFDEETRRIAFDLLDRSLEIEKAIREEREYGSNDNQSLN